MGIFDFLSGSDEAETAAAQNAAALAAMQEQANKLYGTYQTQGLGALGGARTATLDQLRQGLTGQTGAYGQGIEALRGVGTGPLEQAITAYQAGVGGAQGGVAGALAAGQGGVDTLRQLGQSYQPAIDRYYGALGLRGPEGSAEARAGFQTSPGYQFQVDEAMRNALAQASKLGIAQSGNTADALRARAQGFAGGEWQDYLNRLQGFVSPQLQAAQGTAQAYGTLGNLGMQGVNAAVPWTQGLAGAYNNLFLGQRGLAGDISGQYANIGNAIGQNYGARAIRNRLWPGRHQPVRQRRLRSGAERARRRARQHRLQQCGRGGGAADAANYWGAINAGIGATGKALAPRPA